MSWLRNILAGPEPDEILPGDWVKRPGFRGAGVVEEVKGDFAIVAYRGARHIAVPVKQLRRVKSVVGWSLDMRR